MKLLPGSGRVHYGTRALLNDPIRLAISIGALGFAVLLVLLLRAILDGTVSRSTTYIDNVGADLFVAGEGVEHMSLASSVLPASLVSAVAEVPGVDAASGILRLPVIVSVDGNTSPATAIGHTQGLGGPWSLAEGRHPGSPEEAVLDEHLANELDVEPGDSVELAGNSLEIVGLSSETSAIAGKLIFVSRSGLAELAGGENIVHFVLVRAEPGADRSDLASAIAGEAPGTSVLTREQLSSNDQVLLADLFVAPIDVMSTAGFLVGVAIIGLTMYTNTAERRQDFGVLKAIGASNAYLVRAVLTQAAVLGLLGFATGLGATYLAGGFIERLVPDIGVALQTGNALRALSAALAMSIIGAVIAVIPVVRADPMLVFHR